MSKMDSILIKTFFIFLIQRSKQGDNDDDDEQQFSNFTAQNKLSPAAVSTHSQSVFKTSHFRLVYVSASASSNLNPLFHFQIFC